MLSMAKQTEQLTSLGLDVRKVDVLIAEPDCSVAIGHINLSLVGVEPSYK